MSKVNCYADKDGTINSQTDMLETHASKLNPKNTIILSP